MRAELVFLASTTAVKPYCCESINFNESVR
jgi:hypothetical protein